MILYKKTGLKSGAVVGVFALALQAWAQTLPKAIYVESFRKGPTRISEQAIIANLTAENANYRVTIKDSAGNDRFQLSLEPQREEGGAERIVSWRVLLTDPHRRYLGNYLVATKTVRAAFGPTSGPGLVAGPEPLRSGSAAGSAGVQD